MQYVPLPRDDDWSCIKCKLTINEMNSDWQFLAQDDLCGFCAAEITEEELFDQDDPAVYDIDAPLADVIVKSIRVGGQITMNTREWSYKVKVFNGREDLRSVRTLPRRYPTCPLLGSLEEVALEQVVRYWEIILTDHFHVWTMLSAMLAVDPFNRGLQFRRSMCTSSVHPPNLLFMAPLSLLVYPDEFREVTLAPNPDCVRRIWAFLMELLVQDAEDRYVTETAAKLDTYLLRERGVLMPHKRKDNKRRLEVTTPETPYQYKRVRKLEIPQYQYNFMICEETIGQEEIKREDF